MGKPEDLLYSETHEWVRLEQEGDQQIAVVGITAFAVEQLTDLTFMELPEVGQSFDAGEAMGEVESVKAVSPLYSPVTGEVVAVNEGLPDQLEVLSEDPYEAGWIAKIKVTDPASLSQLMDYAAYQKQCAAEGED